MKTHLNPLNPLAFKPLARLRRLLELQLALHGVHLGPPQRHPARRPRGARVLRVLRGLPGTRVLVHRVAAVDALHPQRDVLAVLDT